MYGDKTKPKKVKGTGNKLIKNIEFYITEEEYKSLRKERKTQKEIGELVGLNQRTLSKLITRKGWGDDEKYIPPKKYSINENFFKKWTRESAWVYGWLLTDGSIQEKTGHVALNLKRDDKDVLEKIKNVMNFTGKVYDSQRPDGRKSSHLRICRKSMTEDLFNLGMAREDKTFNTTLPNIPDEFYWDFVRGVFEGDGSIRHRKGNTDALDITIASATKQFLLDLQTSLEKRGIFTRLTQSKENLYTVNTKSNADALRMSYFMYANTDESLRLNRKFDVFQNYVTTYYDKIKRRSVPCIELVELIRQNIPECSEDSCAPFLVPKRKAA